MFHRHFLSFPVCTCNGFAEACTFDATRDHGVCTACQSNTAGDFCDSCVEGFYINPEHATDSSLPYCLRKDWTLKVLDYNEIFPIKHTVLLNLW